MHYEFLLKPMQISITRPSDKDRPSGAAWGGRGKVAWGGVGLSRPKQV